MEFLRGVLGVICLGCAYMTGRNVAMVRKGWQKPTRLYAWIVRVVLCLAAVAFRHPVDLIDYMVWALSAVAFSAALWDSSRERPREDLTHAMFPDEK